MAGGVAAPVCEASWLAGGASHRSRVRICVGGRPLHRCALGFVGALGRRSPIQRFRLVPEQVTIQISGTVVSLRGVGCRPRGQCFRVRGRDGTPFWCTALWGLQRMLVAPPGVRRLRACATGRHPGSRSPQREHSRLNDLIEERSEPLKSLQRFVCPFKISTEILCSSSISSLRSVSS